MPSNSALPRNAAIDLLRGVAITLVLLLHFSLTYRLSASPLADIFGRDAVRAVVNNGNYGVTMFFVVSGFLIASNLVRRNGSLGAVELRTFYAMRIARIVPPLLLALAIIVPLGLLGVPSFANDDGPKALPPSFFLLAVGSVLSFTHNLLMQSAGYFNYCLNVYWSLSVEEMFYLGFPLLCIVAKKDWLIALACVAAIAIGPIYRSMHSDDEIWFMYGNAACFDAIAFGVLAALAATWWPPSRRVAAVLPIVASIALAIVYLNGIGGHEVFGFTGIAACSALIVYGAGVDSIAGSSRAFAASKIFAPIRWAGRHSYEIYLFHIIVLAAMRDLVKRDQLGPYGKLMWLLLFIALTMLAAGLVARYFAEPMNRAVRRRFVAVREPIANPS